MEALSLLAGGLARPEPQDHAGATYAPKIDRETPRLDWRRTPRARAPGARVRPRARRLGHARRRAAQALRRRAAAERGEPGAVLAAGDRLVVACGDGALAVLEVQPAGKTRLTVDAWVRGRGIAVGARLA